MKRTYIIIYEIGENGDENSIIEYIKSTKVWARITSNSFALAITDKKAVEIRDDLLKFKGKDGRIFVIKSGIEAAWSNARGSNDWFKNNL